MQPRKHLLATCSVLLIAALLAACAAPAAAPTATPVPPTAAPVPPTAESYPVAVVQAWVEALNSGDMDAALELFAEDSRYRMHYTANDKNELRWVFTWLTGLETEFEILDCQPQDNRADCSLTVSDGCIAISASPTLPIKSTFTVQDGKIKEVTGSGTGPEWSAYWNFVPVVQSWERVFRPGDYAFYTKNEGTFDAAQVAIKLCRDYENVVKTQEPATAAAAQGLVDAINKGDGDAALALLPNEAKFQMLNDKAEGAEQLRSMFDWLVGKEAQYQITDCEWQGISTQCAVSVTDGCIVASGAADGLHGKMTFYSLEDGTLRQVNVAPSSVERKAYQTWLEAEAAWASANRADEFAQAEGYSQAAGAMAVQLCREYAETLK
jgi:hypothetical protein